MRHPLSVLLSLCTLPAGVLAQWSTPTLVANINTSGSEHGPFLTFDGLTLYYTGYAVGSGDFYKATRTTRYGTFSSPVPVTELNISTHEDWTICTRIDDLEVFFSSQRPGGGGGSYDLWRADRVSPALPFNAPAPVAELNTSSSEYDPVLTADGLKIYFTSARAGGLGGTDIWTATRPSWTSPFGTPTPVVEINSSSTDRGPHISPDDLMIWFTSSRSGSAGEDFWVASRTSRTQPFGTPTLLAALNSSSTERNPATSSFGDEIFTVSNRTGGLGSNDIYVSRFTGLVGSGVAGPSSTQGLRFCDPASPRLVYVAAAALGSTPGIQLGANVLPLNPDPLFSLTVGGLPPLLTGYTGILDADGVAGGAITFSGFPQLVGFRFVTAFVVLDGAFPFGMKTFSNALETLVQ